MRTRQKPFLRSWPGRFPDRRELPREPLYELRLSFRHGADGQAAASLRSALAPVAGEPRVRKWPFLATTLAWESHAPPIRAKLGEGEMEIRLGHRIKGNALARLVEALAQVPGAQALSLSGHTRCTESGDDSAGPGGCCP